MRTPAWAAARSFPRAYAALRESEAGKRSLTRVNQARVITVPQEQVEAIPVLTAPIAVETLRTLRLPFDDVYLDLGATPFFFGFEGKVEGVMASRDAFEGGNNGLTSTGLICFVSSSLGFGMAAFGGLDQTNDGEWCFGFTDDGGLRSYPGHPDPMSSESAQKLQVALLRQCIAVLDFLQSANVSLAETPLSPKQRSRELAKGRQIALTVVIRQPRKSVPRGGTANYSHRFEVRGHYMHFTRGPVFERTPPEKRAYVPGIGECRKVWCPPHVKGPQDKPLVPKVRVVEAIA